MDIFKIKIDWNKESINDVLKRIVDEEFSNMTINILEIIKKNPNLFKNGHLPDKNT